MAAKPAKNYAFVDSHNVYLGVRSVGWELDFERFRTYLREKHDVEKAFLFIGYLSSNKSLYRDLEEAGYVCVFKETVRDRDGKVKGNCDAELVLQAMIELAQYEQAVIVSGDGDFACLVRHLDAVGKLCRVIAPNSHKCSMLLKKAAGERLSVMDQLAGKLGKKRIPPRQNPAGGSLW